MLWLTLKMSQNVLFIYISHQLTVSSQNGASQYIFLIYPPFSNCSRQSESLIWDFKLDTEHTLGIKIIKIHVRVILVSTEVSLAYIRSHARTKTKLITMYFMWFPRSEAFFWSSYGSSSTNCTSKWAWRKMTPRCMGRLAAAPPLKEKILVLWWLLITRRTPIVTPRYLVREKFSA